MYKYYNQVFVLFYHSWLPWLFISRPSHGVMLRLDIFFIYIVFNFQFLSWRVRFLYLFGYACLDTTLQVLSGRAVNSCGPVLEWCSPLLIFLSMFWMFFSRFSIRKNIIEFNMQVFLYTCILSFYHKLSWQNSVEMCIAFRNRRKEKKTNCLNFVILNKSVIYTLTISYIFRKSQNTQAICIISYNESFMLDFIFQKLM